MWDSLHEEYRNAKQELTLAQHHFDNAEPEFVDVAIQGLQLAEMKFKYVLQKMKKLRAVGV